MFFYPPSYDSSNWNILYPAFHLIKLMIQVKSMAAPSEYFITLSGVKAWFWLKILRHFLMMLGLILIGSMSHSSILKVIELISSYAAQSEGAKQPLRTHIIFRTFSTRGWGFMRDLSSIIWLLERRQIECSVILTA